MKNIQIDLTRISKKKWQADISMLFSRDGLTAYRAVANSPELATTKVINEYKKEQE